MYTLCRPLITLKTPKMMKNPLNDKMQCILTSKELQKHCTSMQTNTKTLINSQLPRASKNQDHNLCHQNGITTSQNIANVSKFLTKIPKKQIASLLLAKLSNQSITNYELKRNNFESSKNLCEHEIDNSSTEEVQNQNTTQPPKL